MGVYSLPRGLSAMWCPGEASGVDIERLEGAHTGVREGRPIGRFGVFGVSLWTDGCVCWLGSNVDRACAMCAWCRVRNSG